MPISSRGESGVGGGSRGVGGIGGSGGRKVNKINKNGAAKPIDAATKKRLAANEKSLNDAVSRILNGPWRNDL